MLSLYCVDKAMKGYTFLKGVPRLKAEMGVTAYNHFTYGYPLKCILIVQDLIQCNVLISMF